ncbi:MAG: response regulator [Synechococcales cyanobacterium C42_A2020_086]|jgi:CheY-like chemotaxis protein|nr:response regulator [Synechococcales cyanobacterium C42_A2020_086]
MKIERPQPIGDHTGDQGLVTAQEPLDLKILIVEDNLTNQNVILKQLQTLGYSADLAADGQAALHAIEQSPYDIVFMDCRLPVLDGFSATQLIRQREQYTAPHKKLIIIAMTASDLPQDQAKAMAVGMDDYLHKPVRREMLAATLQRWSQNLAVEHSFNPPRNKFLDSQNPVLLRASDADSLLPADGLELHLDLEHLHLLSDNNPEFELELLALFMDDTRRHLEKLRQAIASADASAAEQIAHHIKGASASIGAYLIQQIAEEIEQIAHVHQLQDTSSFVAQLDRALHHIQAFL